MKMTRHTIPTALAASLLISAQTATAGNESRSKAYPLSNGLIEVVADFSENAVYWCGVGDYALLKLSKRGSDRIYVWQGPAQSAARPGQRAVTFSFQPPRGKAGSTPLTTDVNIIGNSLSVSQAKRTCDERTASG